MFSGLVMNMYYYFYFNNIIRPNKILNIIVFPSGNIFNNHCRITQDNWGSSSWRPCERKVKPARQNHLATVMHNPGIRS